MAALLLCTSLQSKAYSIKDSLSVSIQGKDMTIAQVFKVLHQQTGYIVFYSNSILDDQERLDMNFINANVKEIMDFLTKGKQISYVIRNNFILLQKAQDPVSATLQPSLLAKAELPDTAITGAVHDEQGQPLPGVSVLLKGTTVGTVTDASGNYSIQAPDTHGTLVFSYVGFETKEVPMNSQTNLDVVLGSSVSAISQVVVTALGIKRESKALTYATQTVQGEDIGKTKDVEMVNSLQGRVAGLTITRSPDGPGSNSTVLLRGNRSITGNNAPLYITDGVPSSIGLEDGDNIESITVLKGASAAALYGSAGQNGAIIITTKKGVSGKISVAYNGGISFDQAEIFEDLQFGYGQGDAGLYVENSEHSWGPKTDGQMVTLWNGNSVPLSGQPNRFKNFFRTGMTLNNSISLTGGTERMQTYFSYGNIEAQGIMRNNDLTRHMFNLRISNTVSSKLSFDAKATYIHEDINNQPNDYAITSIFRAPTSIPLDEMKKYEYTDVEGNLKQSYWKPGSSIIGNPYFYMYRDLSTDRNNQLFGLFSAKYSFTSWLDVMARASLTKSFGKGDHKIYSDSYFSLVGSDYDLSTNDELQSYIDVLATFKHDLSDDFNISGNVGGSVQGSQNASISATANGLNKDNFFFMENAKAPITTNTISKSPQVQALFAEATLGYKSFLFLDVTARNDWSSALPEDKWSIFYPSAGITAIVSDMLKLPTWITYGKVRASIANSGYGGNAYLVQEYYSVETGGLIVTPTIQSIGNYKPELTTSLELGLDWRFFDNRLGFDFTFYRTQTKNQLLLIGAPAASTYDQKYINAGLIQNSGVELVMNYSPIRAGKFSWNGSINYAKNNNKVIRLTDEMTSVIIQDDDILTTKVETGKSFGTLYVKGWQRDEDGNKLVDDMGRPLLTSGKTVYAGNFNPNYTMGMYNTFTYSTLALSFLIEYRNGGTIIGGTQALLDADGHSKRSLEGRENGITLDAVTLDGAKNNQVISSQEYFSSIGDRKPAGEEYAYSATNVRLREVSLDYILPKKIFERVNFIQSAKIAVVGKNLFFFKRSAPFDPDIVQGRGGEEVTALPFTRTLGVNLRITF